MQQGLISQIDLMPSVLDYCGIPMPGADWRQKAQYSWGQVHDLAPYPGTSWIPLLKDLDAQIHGSVVIENDNPATGYNIRSLITQTHRVTVYPHSRDGELFDLANDPDELFNLWNKPEARNLKQRLIEELLSEYSAQTPFHPVPPWNS